jgi:tetratricopeptide (TPR) repeat protein
MVDRYPVKYWIVDFLEAQVQRRIARSLLDSKKLMDHGKQALKEARPQEAAESLVRALEPIQDDRRMEAARFEIDGLLASSDEAFAKAAGLRPDDPQLWVARGRYLAWHGRWKEAAEAYGRGVVAQPVWFDWIEYGSVLVLADELDGYQKFCSQMLERVGKPGGFRSVWSAAQTQAMAARVARLHPASGIGTEQILDWADEAALKEPLAQTYYTAAAARLRAGRYAEAATLAHRSIEELPEWSASDLNWYVLAVAHQKQGHGEEARRWLEKAEVAQAKRKDEAAMTAYPPPGYYLADALEALVLEREARTLLQSKSAATQPK